MMRVAFVSVSDQMGGSEVVLVELIRGLRRTRPSWDLHLIAPGIGPLSQAARASGVGVDILAMPRSLAAFGETAAVGGGIARLPMQLVRLAVDIPAYEARLSDALARIGPDAVHTNGLKAHVIVARVRAAGAALIWHMHDYVSRRPITRALLRRYAARCDAVVANSDSVAADVRAVIGGVASVRTIHNAVDLDRFAPQGRSLDLDRRSGLTPAPSGTVRVGLMATFARWKGHEVFLRALAAISPDVPIRGYIVGGPVYETKGSQYSIEELQALARELGVADRVGFTGFLDAPAEALRALDVVVHASTAPEPFGMVIAEAMACGRALITSGTGGAAELVRSEENAVLHRMGDAADLAAHITQLATDPEQRRRLGEKARAAALEQFDARRLTDEFSRLYEARARMPGSRG